MLEFITKYWLQELFGLIVIILSFVAKKAWKQWSKAKQALNLEKEKEREQRIFDKLDENFDEIIVRLDDLEENNRKQDEAAEIRQQGILALYGKQFMSNGKELLKPNHIITYDEFADYSKQHNLYNKLGGNHEGDEQFQLVKTKYENGLDNK